jgi:branched-chain amino acid transport system substrate-binding protein
MRTRLFLAILVFGAFLGESRSLHADQKPVVKIGVLLSFSGGLQQWCTPILRGVELAASEDSPVEAHVIFEDDHSADRRLTVTAARKLLEIDKVDIVTTWTASLVPLLAPIAASTRTPLFVGAWNQNVANGGPFVFGGLINMDLLPRDIARFLIQKRGARRLALVMAADDWAETFEKPFSAEVRKLGATLVLSETVQPDESEFRSLVLRLSGQKVDAVLATLFSTSLYAFLKQARELRYPGVIHVADGMFEEDLKIAGENAEGVYASQIWLESKRLARAVQARYGGGTDPLQLGLVASGYDWVKHIQGAAEWLVKGGKSISRENLREALSVYESKGYLGKQKYSVAPEATGELMVVVKDGKYVLAEGKGTASSLH